MSDDEKSDDLPDTQPTEVAVVAEQAGTSATRPLPTQEAAATEVVEPVPAPTEPAEPQVVVAAPKKRRRRWPWVVGGILVVLGVLGTIAFFVGDAYAKDYARQYIKDRIIAVLGIEDGTPVTVDIGDGSVLLQALRGELDQIDVTADQVTFGILKGAATVHAEGVPLDQNAPVDSLQITFAVAEGDVGALAGNLSGMELQSIKLDQPEIVANT
ncbi:MAG TPA: LmeA family phospholipid-binding protein, partial [Pseudolysinimonas sp.]